MAASDSIWALYERSKADNKALNDRIQKAIAEWVREPKTSARWGARGAAMVRILRGEAE